MVNGIIMTVLTIESISDIKTKSMSCVRLTIYFLMALLGNLIFGYQSVISMAGGIAIGIIVLIYGLITMERKRYIPKRQYLTEFMRSSGHIHLGLRSIHHS